MSQVLNGLLLPVILVFMALLVNREEFAERAEILREKGTNRSQFFRGEVDKYTWVGLGSSYLPSDILAAAETLRQARRSCRCCSAEQPGLRRNQRSRAVHAARRDRCGLPACAARATTHSHTIKGCTQHTVVLDIVADVVKTLAVVVWW